MSGSSAPDAPPLVAAAAQALGPPGTPDDDARHAWRDAAVVAAVEAAWAGGRAEDVRALADAHGRLLRLLPHSEAGRVVLRPTGAGERRRRGAFATPPALADVLAARAVTGAGAVVDPACGSGALLRAALRRLVGLGVPAAQAVRSLHGVDLDPAAVALCRAVLAVDAVEAGAAVAPDDLAARVVVGDALLDEPDGFAWAATFPAVLARDGTPPAQVTGWRGGFGAVVANPPWERLKVIGKDWASPPPGLRAGRAESARAVRTAGRHPLTGSGEINAYLPFVETCWRLLAPDGRASLVVPAGVASDRSAGRLVGALVDAGALERLQLLDPRAGAFDGVSDRVAVALLDLVGSAGRVGATEVGVGVEDPAALPAPRSWSLSPGTLARVNPNTRTLPVSPGPREAALLAAAHDRWPVLVRRSASGAVEDDPWRLRAVTPLHMTRDARHFATAPGPGLVPLWEAKHAGLLDHRGGSRPQPRYWVPAALMEQRWGALWARGWLAGYRNVTTTAAPRTLLPVALPAVGVGNSLPLLSAPRLPLLLAALASLPVDFLARCKHAGANLNFFKLEQLAVPAPQDYDAPAPWEPAVTLADWVLGRFARAVVWDAGLAPLAAELGLPAVPEPDAAQRVRALAELDAAHAVLLGWSRADLETVLATFHALRLREEREHGSYVTSTRVLAAHERLAASRAGAPAPTR